MEKKVKKSILRTLIATALVLIFSITAVAWFYEMAEISPNVNGSATTGYFHAGNGTKEQPYEIKTAKHVYNLAWLQYMGDLNNEKDSTTGKINQKYFKLIDNIDMTGVILPPIGTAEFPFVGHFDGQGFCISNLTVSNYLFGENNEFKIVERPLSVTEIDGETVSVVGFFGVVGAYGETTAEMLANDSDITNIADKVNAIHDLYLDGITVRTETTRSLIGLVAGYANGSIANVGVSGDSGIQLGTKVQPLQMGEAADLTYAVSFYSLVGQYNATNIVWKDTPSGGLVEGGGQGGGTGWGSSINMNQLRDRITYIVGAVGITKSGSLYYANAYGYNGVFDAGQKNYIDGTSIGSVTYFVDGTVMPLSIDQAIFKEDVISGLNFDLTANKPLDTLPYYRDNLKINKEPVVSQNSGYIVGGGTRVGTTKGQYIEYINEKATGRYTSSISQKPGIFKSISSQLSSETNNTLFPENNLHMLTVGTDGNTYVITDSYNTNANTWIGNNYSSDKFLSYSDLGFEKYQTGSPGNDAGVRNAFVNSYKGKLELQGIKFNGKINLSSLEKATVADVVLLGNTYKSYEMIKGAINFSLKEAGRVTTIAATYTANGSAQKDPSLNINAYGNNVIHTLFRIFEVKRDSANKIISCTPINTIHEKKTGNKVEYVYNLGRDYSEDGYTLLFDYEKMSNLTEVGAAYYFEIPLNAGDYAVGSTTDDASKTGASLLYLDIGASGNKVVGGDDTTGTTAVHQIEGMTFVDDAKTASNALKALKENAQQGDNPPALSDLYSVVTFKIEIGKDDYEKQHGGLALVFNRSSKTAMTVTESEGNSKNVFTVTTIKKDDDGLTVAIGPPEE